MILCIITSYKQPKKPQLLTYGLLNLVSKAGISFFHGTKVPIETIATRSEALINVITSGTLKKNKIKTIVRMVTYHNLFPVNKREATKIK